MPDEIVNVFSIDVEDWFHILDLKTGVPRHTWLAQDSRVERNTERLLHLLRRHGTYATCFILGWIAEHYPSLVETIYLEGHEVATHGYGHELVYDQGPDPFRADVERSIELLKSLLFVQPQGYRAPGFSVTRETLWVFSILAELGLAYDSSIFPAARGHGGLQGAYPSAHRIELDRKRHLIELPISTTTMLGRRVAYCGGGYLRALPLRFISSAIREANAIGIPVVLYIHPRDIDPHQPRIPMPRIRRFKSYVGLNRAYDKLNALIQEFPFGRADRLVERLQSEQIPRVRVSSGTMVQVQSPGIVSE